MHYTSTHSVVFMGRGNKRHHPNPSTTVNPCACLISLAVGDAISTVSHSPQPPTHHLASHRPVHFSMSYDLHLPTMKNLLIRWTEPRHPKIDTEA